MIRDMMQLSICLEITSNQSQVISLFPTFITSGIMLTRALGYSINCARPHHFHPLLYPFLVEQTIFVCYRFS